MINYDLQIYQSAPSNPTQFNADLESLQDEGAFSPGKREIPIEQNPVSIEFAK